MLQVPFTLGIDEEVRREFIDLVSVYVNACQWRYTDITPMRATRAVSLAYNLTSLEVQHGLDTNHNDAPSAVREFVSWVFGRDSKPAWVSEDRIAAKEMA